MSPIEIQDMEAINGGGFWRNALAVAGGALVGGALGGIGGALLFSHLVAITIEPEEKGS